MQRDRLPDDQVPNSERQAVIWGSLDLLLLATARPELGYLALATVYRAPIYAAARIDQTTFVAGKTRAMKSELTALMLAHFGPFTARDFPANREDSVADLEIKACHARDAILVIDGFKPTGGKGGVEKLHAKADRILRGAGNRSGRGRRKGDLRARATYFPRCFLVSSGEDVPKGESLRGRMVVVDIKQGDIDSARLSRLQLAVRRRTLALSTAGFIRWLAPQRDRLDETLPAEIASLRSRSDLPSAHARGRDNLGNLVVGLRLFLRYALECDVIEPARYDLLLQEGEQHLIALMDVLAQSIRDADEVDRFPALLRAAVHTGRAHLCHAKANGVPEDTPSF